MHTLNIIGCGRVGKTLGRLLIEHELVRIKDVMNRSRESTERAVAFLGQGRAVTRLQNLRTADIHLLAVNDDEICGTAGQLAECGIVCAGDTVLHCSGALSSTLLSPLRPAGAFLASVHPVKSFADPETAAATFPETFCAIEGDIEARKLLADLFTMVGGQIIFLTSEDKIIYHATTVFASNYLTAILKLGQRCCRQAGMDETTARGLMEPLALETAANVFRLGPARALTGPIARGDSGLVADQLNALSTWQTATGEIYRLLGKVALELARQTETACPRKLDMVAESLKKPTQS